MRIIRNVDLLKVMNWMNYSPLHIDPVEGHACEYWIFTRIAEGDDPSITRDELTFEVHVLTDSPDTSGIDDATWRWLRKIVKEETGQDIDDALFG